MSVWRNLEILAEVIFGPRQNLQISPDLENIQPKRDPHTDKKLNLAGLAVMRTALWQPPQDVHQQKEGESEDVHVRTNRRNGRKLGNLGGLGGGSYKTLWSIISFHVFLKTRITNQLIRLICRVTRQSSRFSSK